MTLEEAVTYFTEEAELRERMSQLGGSFVNETRNEQEKRIHAEAAKNNGQLAEWLTELKVLRESSVAEEDYISLKYAFDDAKGLLKLAVEDFSNMYDHIYDCDGMCETCPIHGNRDTCDKWRYADEALTLIGDEPNGI